MTDTIFAIFQIGSKEIIFKPYYSLKKLCRDYQIDYDMVKDKLPFKYKDKVILKSKVEE